MGIFLYILMARIDIDFLYKAATLFEEESLPPPTLPAGAIPATYTEKSYLPEVKEVPLPPTTRFLFQQEIDIPAIKNLMERFHQIFDLSRGAIELLRSMKKNTIFDPTRGIDAYIETMEDELKDIVQIVGRRFG